MDSEIKYRLSTPEGWDPLTGPVLHQPYVELDGEQVELPYHLETGPDGEGWSVKHVEHEPPVPSVGRHARSD